MSFRLYNKGDMVRLKNAIHIRDGESYGVGIVIGYHKLKTGKDCKDTPMIAWSDGGIRPALWCNIELCD